MRDPAAVGRLRLRYRRELPATVAAADRAAFRALVLEEFKSLHAGNAVRFGLGALEVAAWERDVAGR